MEPWPQVHPGILQGVRAAGACERRAAAAGWQVALAAATFARLWILVGTSADVSVPRFAGFSLIT